LLLFLYFSPEKKQSNCNPSNRFRINYRQQVEEFKRVTISILKLCFVLTQSIYSFIFLIVKNRIKYVFNLLICNEI